jgi:hypothetical protein
VTVLAIIACAVYATVVLPAATVAVARLMSR